MIWSVQLSDQAVKQLKKLDPVSKEMIMTYLETRIDGCADPRQYGEPLTANRSGQWRYRVGQYRILCEIEDAVVTVFVVAVGHRRSVYKR